MKTIVVSGRKSGVGKTHLACELLMSLSGWSALKVTVDKGGDCPRNKNCGICRNIRQPFYIVKDADIINQPGKDTALLKQAGAKEVAWLVAKTEALEPGLKKALSEFDACCGVVIEGTSVLKFLKPDLNIHVLAKGNYELRR